MSIDYVCDLDTGASAAEIASRLNALIGGEIAFEEEQITVTTGAIFAYVRETTEPHFREWSIQDWGIDPRIEIIFSLNRKVSETESLAGRRDFTLAAVRLGEGLDVDMLLSFETERAIVRRKNGALTLYDWWPEWINPEVLAKLPAGYTLVNDGREQKFQE